MPLRIPQFFGDVRDASIVLIDARYDAALLRRQSANDLLQPDAIDAAIRRRDDRSETDGHRIDIQLLFPAEKDRDVLRFGGAQCGRARDLVVRRAPPGLLPEPILRRAPTLVEFPDLPRQAYGAYGIAEIVAHLAFDHRPRVGCKRHVGLDPIAIESLQEPDGRDLAEVVVFFARARVPGGGSPAEIHVFQGCGIAPLLRAFVQPQGKSIRFDHHEILPIMS